MRPGRLSCWLAKQEREKKSARLQQRQRIRQPAKVFIRVRPLEHSLRTKQNEAHDEDIEARHGRRRSGHNPGGGGERAVAFLADAPRGAPQAESPTTPQTKPASPLSPARLGQMLAPIALYPDDLLADVLAAATYPLDVVEAARWLQDPQNAALKGDQLFAALQQKSWDPSVKSLTPFPRILRMLDANLEWTEQLGEAYLANPAAVMDAVQRLRRRAQLAGRLVTTSQEIVRTEQEPTRIEETVTIETPSSRGRLRADLRSFIRLRSLALPRLSAVFSHLRGRDYRRVRLDHRPDHRTVRIELSHAAYRDRPQATGPV